MYAVVRTGGKQYRMSQGDTLKIEKLNGKAGEKVTFEDVLMVGGNGDVKIGTPKVNKAQVVAEILDQNRARKILVFKKKRRKAFAKRQGHRQPLTTIKVLEIKS